MIQIMFLTNQVIIPDTYQFLDYGLDLYAPQSTVDETGQRIITAWLRMPEEVDDKWNGMFCMPRIVEEKNGISQRGRRGRILHSP